MSLANQLLASNPSLFPSFPSPTGFFSDLKSFADSNFSNFRSVEVYKGLTIYAGVTEDDEITTDYYVKEFSGWQYRDVNKTNQYEEKSSDIKLTDFRVFISHDGAFLLKKYNSLKGKLREDEIALFLEWNEKDVFSDSITLLLAGDKAKKYVADLLQSKSIQDSFFIGPERQKKMIETIINSNSLLDAAIDAVIYLQDEVIQKVKEIGVSIFGTIESFFTETLRIPDKFWDSDDPEYMVGQVGDSIEGLLIGFSHEIDSLLVKYSSLISLELEFILLGIKKFADYILELFKGVRIIGEFFVALVCGIWNGIMDTIGAIFGLIKLVIIGVAGIAKIVNSADYYNALVLEYLDNMFVEAIKIDWKEVINEASKEMLEIAFIMIRIPEIIIKKITEINHTEAGYYIGYILFEIVSWIFPPLKIAELGKLSKLTKFDKIRKASNIIPDATISKGGNYIDAFFEFIEPFIKKLKAGTKSFKEFIIEVFQKFKKWINELFTTISKPSTEVTELFRRGKSKTAKGEVRFRRPELDVFARKLEKKYAHLNLRVNIVTNNGQANKIRLKRWDKENVLGSFAPGPPPIIHVRQRCTHLTMQHEIWHLEDYNRLGIQEYKKILNWKHEESVWFKVHANRHLWTEIELADSYKYYKSKALTDGGSPVINQEMEELIKRFKL